MIFLTHLFDSSSVRHKNRNVTLLYQVVYLISLRDSNYFFFLNPRKIVKKFALCYPQKNATCAIKTNNLLELSKLSESMAVCLST